MPKKTITLDTKFYTFNQNNSGGSFHVDGNVCHYVIIEATSSQDANDRAERIGIYFDGVSRGRDCPCCGSRWSTIWSDEDGDEEPLIYGQSPESFDFGKYNLSRKGEVQCRIHFVDGSKKEY